MILVDSSLWIDHIRRGNDALRESLDSALIVTHEFVIGEIVLGTSRKGQAAVEQIKLLPRLALATHDEVGELVRRERLAGLGLGWVDAHLLASASIGGARVWTLDRAMHEVAVRLRMSA